MLVRECILFGVIWRARPLHSQEHWVGDAPLHLLAGVHRFWCLTAQESPPLTAQSRHATIHTSRISSSGMLSVIMQCPRQQPRWGQRRKQQRQRQQWWGARGAGEWVGAAARRARRQRLGGGPPGFAHHRRAAGVTGPSRHPGGSTRRRGQSRPRRRRRLRPLRSSSKPP